MLLHIVIPTLNEAPNLKVLLPYLRKHSPEEKTIITVVDAKASTDQSQMICDQYGVNYLSAPNTSRATQMNLGATSKSADAYLFLHADVRPPSQFYDKIQQSLATNHEFGLFAYRFDKSKWYLRINGYFTRFDGIFCGGGDQCHFMTRNTFLAMKGYNEQQAIMEDFELFERIKKNDIPYEVVRSKAVVSSRKYNTNHFLRVNIINLLAVILFKLKYPPEQIKSFYHRWLKLN